MDTLTQAALGATIGLAGFRSSIGRPALWFGAACGLLPDIDVLASVLGPWENLEFHRSWTHSVLILPVIAPAVAWVGRRLTRSSAPLGTWTHLAFWALVTHPLLDTCTTYGTQLLAPVSDTRFTIDAVSVLDPVYTLPLVLALALARWSGWDEGRQARLAGGALILSTTYLGVGWAWSQQAETRARQMLRDDGFEARVLRTPPPLLFGPIRKVVAQDDEGRIRVGLLSLWSDETPVFHTLESDEDPFIDAALATPQGRVFRWFSDGLLYKTVQRGDSGAEVYLDDQRYGGFTDVTRTPFRATAVFDARGELQVMRLDRRTDRLNPRDELAAAWRVLWTNRP